MGKLAGAGAVVILFPILVVVIFLGGTGGCPASQAVGTVGAAALSTDSQQLTIVGDSITVMARSELQSRFPAATIEAKGAMPWAWGVDQLAAMKARGTLAPVVAFLLGTNQGVTTAQISALLAAYSTARFVLMTVDVPFGYTATTNAAVVAAARQNPQRVVVADWHARVTANPALLGPDHVHPVAPAGTRAFADVVAGAVSAAATPAAVSLAAASSRGPAPPWTQAQMEAAVAKYDPEQAHVLGAIAMAETGGSSFPSVNPTGVYHGPWAFQEASQPGLDFSPAGHRFGLCGAGGGEPGAHRDHPSEVGDVAGDGAAVPARAGDRGGRRHAHRDRRRYDWLCDVGGVHRGRRDGVGGRLDVPAAHHPGRASPRQSDRRPDSSKPGVTPA